MTNFDVRLNRRDIGEAELLADLKRVAIANGRTSVTAKEYDRSGQFNSTTMIRKFGSWNEAVIQAELTIRNRQNISNEELFENIACVWAVIGRQPYGRDASDRSKSKFSLKTYETRFGSWNKALTAFANYISNDRVLDENVTTVGSKPSQRKDNSSNPRGAGWRLRATILIRDACTCCMCGASPARDLGTVLHVDHIVPWSKGGATVEENLRTLCERCNIGRSNVL